MASLSSRVVQVVELWRFPVKSFQGEQLDAAEIGPDGIVGDRAYAVFDLDTSFGLTARRVPELLLASARLVDGDLVVTLPDGTESTDDRVLSDWLGRVRPRVIYELLDQFGDFHSRHISRPQRVEEYFVVPPQLDVLQAGAAR